MIRCILAVLAAAVSLVASSAAQPGYIWSEDKEYIMVHGVDRTLDTALQVATTGMSSWLRSHYQLSDSEVAALLSPTIRYDVAVIVNSRPHIVARLSKQILASLKIDRKRD